MIELEPALGRLRALGILVAVAEPGGNLGFAAGIDAGMKAILDNFGVGYVLLINADAALQSGALQKLVARAQALRTPAAVAPILLLPNGMQIAWIYYHRLLGLIFNRRLPGTFRYLSGCCLLLTPELAHTRVFDPRFFFYGDDVDLGYRALMKQVSLELVPDAFVLHEGSGASRKGSMFYEYHIPRSHFELVRTLTHSDLDRLLATLGRLITLFLRALIRTYRFRSWTPFRGLTAAWSDYRRMSMRAFTPKN
ncbi:MAG: glycosyltransferase family 2 protein [Gammaproteobacteria bacterium]|nr:glycosyltransferase family 2 protein [Gammaproteobacteria bacterium]